MTRTSDLSNGRRLCARYWGTGLIALALAGCSGGKPPARAADTPHNVTLTETQQKSIRIHTVAPSEYRTTVTTTGVVDFDHHQATPVLAPFSGPVTRVLVRLGQHVRQGQRLALVESPDYTAAVGAYRKARLGARAADAIAANDRALYAHRAISERENAQAQADAAGADADRAAALQALVALHMDPKTLAALRAGKPVARGLGAIRAPITGTVVELAIAPGQTLSGGSSRCFTLAATTKMWVMAHLFGSDVRRVRTGDPAVVDAGDGGGPVDGTVTNVGSVVDPDTRALSARVRVANPDDALKKGMYVEVRIHSRERRTGLLIPVGAVLRDAENLPFVYVAARDGSYARRPVTLGRRIGDRFVIPAGLKAGEKVVVDGSIFLHFIETQ